MTSGLRNSIVQWSLLLLFESISDVCLHFSLVNLDFPAGMEMWSSAQMVPWAWRCVMGARWVQVGERECRMADAVCKDGKAKRKYRARRERRPEEAVRGGTGCAPWAATARGKQHGPLHPPAGTEGRSRAKPPSASWSRISQFLIPQKRAASPLPFILSPTSLHSEGPSHYASRDFAPAMISVTPPSPPLACDLGMWE